MTSPLPPKFTYFNGSTDSSLFIRRGEVLDGLTGARGPTGAMGPTGTMGPTGVMGPTGPTGVVSSEIASPFTVRSVDNQQRITITATSGGSQGILMRNDALDPDGVVAMQMSVDGKAQIQTIAGITDLLDPIVNVGNGLQNSQLNITGALGSQTKIEQLGDRSRITNPKHTTNGAIEFYASTNSVHYILAPRDKDAGIRIYNSTFFNSLRYTEIGLSQTGAGYIKVNQGTELNLIESTVRMGDGLSGNPQVLVSGLPGEGRVYDTRYNKVASRIWELTVPPTLNANTYNYNIELGPGKYQMQVMMKLFQSDAQPIVEGTSLEIWVQRRAGVSPNLYRNFSEIHIKPAMIQLPGNNNSNEPTFCSGLFEVNEANEEWAVWIVANGNWFLGDEGASTGLFFEFHRISAITDSA